MLMMRCYPDSKIGIPHALLHWQPKRSTPNTAVKITNAIAIQVEEAVASDPIGT